MDTKVIQLSDLEADPRGVLGRCYDSGQSIVIELPNRGLISIQPLAADDSLFDDLIEHNPKFRALLAKSMASPREPYSFAPTVMPQGEDHSSS
jgi:hypothetical protein